MTALCGGGTSSVIDLNTLFLNLTGAAIVDILVTGGMSWITPVAAGVGYLAYDLTGLCGTDPPVVAAPTPEQVFGWTNPLNPTGAMELRTYLTDLVANFLWHQYCKCDSGPAPPAFVGFPQPTGQQTDPTTPGPAATACANFTWFQQTPVAADGSFSQTPQANVAITVPVQWATFVHNSIINGNVGDVGYPVTLNLRFLDAVNGRLLGTQTFTETHQRTAASPYQDTFQLPPGTKAVTMDGVTSLGTSGTLGLNDFLHMYCTATPPSAQEPCCPPDPTLTNMIIQILQNEQIILNLLGGNRSYTRGKVHAGLTGEGTVTVTGLFGVLVELTTGVPTTPQLPGVPPYQVSVGWISLLTGDGMIDEVRLTRQAQVWASSLAPYATTFGYHLNPGFTATLTELVPA